MLQPAVTGGPTSTARMGVAGSVAGSVAVSVGGGPSYMSLSFLDSPLFNFLFPPSLIFYFRAKGCSVHAVHITRGSRPSD